MAYHHEGGRKHTSWLGSNIEVFSVKPTRPKQLDAGYASFIDYLCSVAHLGYSIIYPLSDQKTYMNQRTGLYLAARNRQLKIKVNKVDTYRLKVTLLSWDIHTGKRKVAWQEHFAASDIELIPTVEPTSFIHDDDHEGYAAFIDKLEDCGPKGYGVLYKLRETRLGCTEILQRAGLYTAARRRGIWISIEKQDRSTLRVYWRGTSPYTSVYHQGVRRQHERDDDASKASKFARLSEKQGKQ